MIYLQWVIKSVPNEFKDAQQARPHTSQKPEGMYGTIPGQNVN